MLRRRGGLEAWDLSGVSEVDEGELEGPPGFDPTEAVQNAADEEYRQGMCRMMRRCVRLFEEIMAHEEDNVVVVTHAVRPDAASGALGSSRLARRASSPAVPLPANALAARRRSL